MADYKVTDSELTSIADAIRAKADISTQLTFPTDFISEIENMPSQAVIEPLAITANGTYDPPSGVDGYGPVTVDIVTPSNIAPSLITADNFYYQDVNPLNAFGNNLTNWWGAATTGTHYLSIKFYEPKEITQVKFQNVYITGNYHWHSGRITFQGSVNGTTWIDLFDADNLPDSANTEYTRTIQNSNEYEYYRFVCYAGSSYIMVGVGRIQLTMPPDVIRPLDVAQNGTYNPPSGVKGYAPVTVHVSGGGDSDTYAFIIATYPSGATCTATNGSITFTAPDTSGTAVFAIPTPISLPETWTITATLDGSSVSTTAAVSSYGARYEVNILAILPNDYKAVEYLEVGSTAGPYIATGVQLSDTAYFEIKAKYQTTPNSSTWLFGAWVPHKDTILGYYNSKIRFQIGGTGPDVSFDTNSHVYSSDQNGVYIDGVLVGSANWTNVPTNLTYHLFKIDGQNSPTNNVRVYSCKIWNNGSLVRNFIPCYRKSDNEPGMYDSINGLFYTNNGTGSFSLGPEV